MKENEIEKRITSMLEDVLKDDSDDAKKDKPSTITINQVKPSTTPIILINNMQIENSIIKDFTPDGKNPNNFFMKPPLKKNFTHDSFPHKSLLNPFDKQEIFPINKDVSKNKTKRITKEDEIENLLKDKIKIIEKIEKSDLSLLRGSFFKLLTSQNGSRILQKALQNSHYSVLNKIFEEIKDNISDLMVDSYANYFCPVFYSYLEIQEKLTFLTKVYIP
jgi:hypothetical protein